MESYKNSNISTAKKEQHEHTKIATKKGKKLSSLGAETIADKSVNDSKILSAEHENTAPVSQHESVQKENVQSQNNAHFDLPPDTEDL